MLIQLQYLLEVSTCLLLGFLLYWFFLRKKHLFQWNRAYLLIWPICCFLIPAMEFDWIVWTEVPQLSLPGSTLNWLEAEQLINEVQYPELSQNLEESQVLIAENPSFPVYSFIYFLGTLISLLFFAFRILQVKKLIASSTPIPASGYILLENAQLNSISTFGNYIFKRKGEKIHPMILEHELVHVRQKHSLDVILMEIYQILLWFNPLIYLMKKELRETHEYIADAKVIHKHDLLSYAQLLVKEAMKHKTPAISIPFSHITKKRLLNMKTKTKENPWSRFRFMVLLPLFLLLIAVFAFKKVEKVKYVEEKVVAPIVVQWGDQMCQCFESNFKRSYSCDILILAKEKIESLRNTPPQILKNEAFPNDVTYQRLGIPDEYAVKYKHGDPNEIGTPIYFAKTYEELDPKVWNQLKPEDKLRFRLNFQEETFIEFNVAVDGAHPDRVFDAQVIIGNSHYPIDLITQQTKISGSISDFKQLIAQDFSLAINQSVVSIEAIDITRHFKDPQFGYLKTERIMNLGEKTDKFSDLDKEPIFQDLAPGEMVSLAFIHNNGKRYFFNYQIIGEHPIKASKVHIQWGPYEADGNQLAIDLKDIKALKNTLPRITIDGDLQEIYKGEILFRNLHKQKDPQANIEMRSIKSYSVNQFQELINARLQLMEKAAQKDRSTPWNLEYLFSWMTIPLENGAYFTFYIKKQGADGDDFLSTYKGVSQQEINFRFPLEKKYIKVISGFGPRIHPIHKKMQHHNGVDFIAPLGAPVYAAAGGEVTKIMNVPEGYGKRIEITHEKGKITSYSHLQTIIVKKGDRIKDGLIQIGTVGNTGKSRGPHLHFEVIIDGKPQDPKAYLPERR